MLKKTYFWVEEYLFDPNLFQRFLSILLLPISFLYYLVVKFKRSFTKAKDFNIAIISIGNLIVGGSGKTPFSIYLAKKLNHVAIILRGYKRQSKDLIVVSHNFKILTDVKSSGDEAMLLAKELKNATIIVSKDRIKAIQKAKKLGAKVILLDDGFSKVNIKKFDILLKPKDEPKNPFLLPSGPYREPKSLYKSADLTLQEGVDFKRVVKIRDKTQKMILITAISKPQRLDPFLPKEVIKKIYYPDHYSFKKDELLKLVDKYKAHSVLTTTKDLVKMENFNLKLSILELELECDKKVLKKVENFLSTFDKIQSKNI